MPRSNRPRGARRDDDSTPLDLGRALAGRLTVVHKRGGSWNVQPLSAAQAAKIYLCPGCGLEIAAGLAHVVTWRADGLMGEADDLAARRHWHSHCWKISP